MIDVQLSDGQSEIFIGTRDGKAIRFGEADVRSMGRTAYGVRGIRAQNLALLGDDEQLLVGVHLRDADDGAVLVGHLDVLEADARHGAARGTRRARSASRSPSR